MNCACVMLPNTKPRMQICIGSQHVAQSKKKQTIYIDEKHNLVTLFSHQHLSPLVMNLEFGLITGTHYLMTLPELCIIQFLFIWLSNFLKTILLIFAFKSSYSSQGSPSGQKVILIQFLCYVYARSNIRNSYSTGARDLWQ